MARGHGHPPLAIERQLCRPLEHVIRHFLPPSATFLHSDCSPPIRAGQRSRGEKFNGINDLQVIAEVVNKWQKALQKQGPARSNESFG